MLHQEQVTALRYLTLAVSFIRTTFTWMEILKSSVLSLWNSNCIVSHVIWWWEFTQICCCVRIVVVNHTMYLFCRQRYKAWRASFWQITWLVSVRISTNNYILYFTGSQALTHTPPTASKDGIISLTLIAFLLQSLDLSLSQVFSHPITLCVLSA